MPQHQMRVNLMIAVKMMLAYLLTIGLCILLFSGECYGSSVIRAQQPFLTSRSISASSSSNMRFRNQRVCKLGNFLNIQYKYINSVEMKGSSPSDHRHSRLVADLSITHLNSLPHSQIANSELSKIYSIRGGAFMSNSLVSNKSTVDVLVSTSIGSNFLDKKKKLSLSANSTVLDLKLQLSSKFPGSPPVDLQQLFFGVRKLNDSELLRNITSLPTIPILLDMITGTSSYGKSLSITQKIEAYVSSVVQQAYIGDQMRSIVTDSSSNAQSSLESSYYRDMFRRINETIYDKYKAEISAALIEESEPEDVTADTKAWRGNNLRESSALAKAFAKKFDLNSSKIKQLMYYTGLLGFFAWADAGGQAMSSLLLGLIPILWISTIRDIRFGVKVLKYLLLPVVSKLDFVMLLLSAPIRAIANACNTWEIDADFSHIHGDEINGQLNDNKEDEDTDSAESLYSQFYNPVNFAYKSGKTLLKAYLDGKALGDRISSVQGETSSVVKLKDLTQKILHSKASTRHLLKYKAIFRSKEYDNHN